MKRKSLKTFLTALGLTLTLSSPAFAGNYTVVSGDSLYKIGKLFNTTSNNLMSTNNTGSSIYPGQVLKVPSAIHTVKSGDTLYLIAKKYGISLSDLRKANNKWNDMLYIGQTLNIPKTSPSSNVSTPTVNSATKSTINYTAAELDLLARLITAEAQNQPYSAQVAVGAVVVNRVKSSTFPSTISSVIYQKDNGYYQFCPVSNGWINKPATETSKKAAREALSGVDASKGALYYFDDSATNKWIWSRPMTTRIGNMIYVK